VIAACPGLSVGASQALDLLAGQAREFLLFYTFAARSAMRFSKKTVRCKLCKIYLLNLLYTIMRKMSTCYLKKYILRNSACLFVRRGGRWGEFSGRSFAFFLIRIAKNLRPLVLCARGVGRGPWA
jgi:hypothetical protein